MADFNKDTKQRIANINAEKDLQTNLSSILQANLDLRTKQGKVGKDILASMSAQKGAEAKLTVLIQEKQKVLENAKELGKERTEQLVEMIQHQEKLLETEKKREELSKGIADAGKDLAKDLGSALGVSNELVSAFLTLSATAIALVVLKEIISYIGEGVKRMREFNKETGASLGKMLEMEGGLIAARSEAGFLKYSMEEIREASDAVRKSTGQIVVDPSLIADITEVNSVLKDADKAQSLTRTLKNSGKDAGELTKEIKDMASSMNMDAGPAMEFLADNQLELRGLTKQQIKQRAEEALIVKKMGVDLEKAKQIASEALDIEKSMKDEMKLRAMTGKQIDMSGLRAAQVSGDALAVAREQKKLIDSVGGSLNGNLQVQRMIGDATGMTAEEMLNIQNASSEQAAEMAKGADATKDSSESLKAMQGFGGMVLKVIIGIGVGLLAIAAAAKIFKLLNKGGGKNPIAKFMGDFGANDVLKGALAMLIVSASMFVMAKAISAMPTEVGPYLGMAVGLGLLLGALYLLAQFPTADLLKGALALAVVGVALIPFAYAMNLIGDISIESILAVAAGILMFTGIILGLGLAFLTPGVGFVFGIGILALLALGAALIVLGSGIVIFNKGVSGLGDNINIFVEKISELISVAPMLGAAAAPLLLFGLSLIPLGIGMMVATPGVLAFAVAMTILGGALTSISGGLDSLQGFMNIVPALSQLVGLVPGLIALSGAFYLLSGSLMTMSLGLAAISFLIPTLAALGVLLPTVSAAINGESSEGSTPTDGASSMAEVVEEIKGLRQDIANQPIMINVDGKVVSEITKVQSRKLSTRSSGYFGGNS